MAVWFNFHLLIEPGTLISKLIFHSGRNNKAYCEQQMQKNARNIFGRDICKNYKDLTLKMSIGLRGIDVELSLTTT